MHLRREVVGTGHRHGLRNVPAQRPIPEADLMNYVLEHVAARVVPVKTPVHVALRIERVGLRRAFVHQRPTAARPAPAGPPRSSTPRGGSERGRRTCSEARVWYAV